MKTIASLAIGTGLAAAWGTSRPSYNYHAPQYVAPQPTYVAPTYVAPQPYGYKIGASNAAAAAQANTRTYGASPYGYNTGLNTYGAGLGGYNAGLYGQGGLIGAQNSQATAAAAAQNYNK